MVCSKEIGPVSREKVDPKFKVIIIFHKQETESPISLVHTKNEPRWWVQKAFKHVQSAYAQCCDAAQAKPTLSRSGLTVMSVFWTATVHQFTQAFQLNM